MVTLASSHLVVQSLGTAASAHFSTILPPNLTIGQSSADMHSLVDRDTKSGVLISKVSTFINRNWQPASLEIRQGWDLS